ncbi:hypothetical protein FGO68_gene10061 [Halteria grandinella]|uniref:Uncharacterized protein n=1 Tax=Halteria grandinella TaxID=5974 RepID=A0A8J8NBK3_HALGN|nr:hypothetical protein FGO68_gene9483 [Halteria grandinella]TNV71864.1 hypothetical protein FGO68_gene10061 [Halteria grandinella]
MVEQVERLQKKAEDLLKENEKLRIDKNQQARKQTPINGALNRFASGMITPTARGMPTKENPVMQSQIFGAGKFETSSKPDPTQLPFTVRDNQSTYIPSLASSFATNIRARLGSPTQHTGQAQLNQQTLLKQSMLGGGMKSQGTLSLRSGSSSGNGTAKEGAINDEPQQQ